MMLYLLQHGEAVDKSVDPERPLSDQGRSDVSKVAQRMAGTGVRVAEIWCSEKKRAIQTGEILAGALTPHPPVVRRDDLDPNSDVRPLAKALRKREEDLAITGHLPHLSYLASRLLTGSEAPAVVAFERGGALALERDVEGVWMVRWFLIPSLL
jgi:phosphohistidine phosphatase